MLRTSTALLLALLLPACDDDGAMTVDAGPTIDAVDVDGGPPEATCTCMAVGADYETGTGAALAFRLPSLEQWPDIAVGLVGADPVLRYQAGRFYVVKRYGASVNVTPVDPADWLAKTQLTPGVESNPQDIAVKDNKAYVVTLDEPSIKVFDLQDPEAAPTLIPLQPSKVDADGNPEASSIVIVGDRAYVSVQHLEFEGLNRVPVANGDILVIDTTTDQVVGTIPLPAQNPLNFLQSDGTTLYAGLAPDFSPTAGCLATVPLAGEPEATCLSSSEALGGFVSGIAPVADGSMYVVVNGSFSSSEVLHLSAAGEVLGESITPDTQQPTDLTVCGKWLVVNDQKDGLGAVRVYDTESGTELTAGDPLDVGAPAIFAGGLACRLD